MIAAHEPLARIGRSEDDIYMLYTGGTTGMPKGVMYDMASHVGSFLRSGFPFSGLTAATDADEVAPLGRADRRGRQPDGRHPVCPLMHGTGLWLGALAPHLTAATVVTLTSRTFDAHELLAAVERDGRRAGHRRRRLRQADAGRARRGRRRGAAVRPVEPRS